MNTITLTLYETGNRLEQADVLRGLADVITRQHEADQEAASPAEEAPDRLPWSFWAPELRESLKELAGRFPAQAIADCAAELARLVAEHGGKIEEHLGQLDRDEDRRR